MSAHVVEGVLEIAHKYNAPIILYTIARMALPELLIRRKNPVKSWYLAVRFGHLDLARTALRSMPKVLVRDLEDSKLSRRYTIEEFDEMRASSRAGLRELSLGDLSILQLDSLTTKAIRDFARLQAKVMAKGGAFTWEDAAEEFTL